MKIQSSPLAGYAIVFLLTFIGTRLFYTRSIFVTIDVEDVVKNVKVEDLIAMSFYNLDNAEKVTQEIKRQYSVGARDRYFLPIKYTANMNNDHFDDTGLRDEYQKEVYLLAKEILRNLKLQEGRQLTAIDVGCGSAYKLVHFLSKEFRTIGIEREPAYSYLKRTYPNLAWYSADNDTASLPEEVTSTFGQCDLGMSSDVIEHFRDPNYLLDVLKSYKCRVYVISTPKRELMSWSGPPGNPHHVREWTFFEFQLYLMSQGFRIIRSFDGVMHMATQFHVVTIA